MDGKKEKKRSLGLSNDLLRDLLLLLISTAPYDERDEREDVATTEYRDDGQIDGRPREHPGRLVEDDDT